MSHPKRLHLLIAPALLSLVAGCATTTTTATATPQPKGMKAFMASKLRHAQSALAAVVAGDFKQIESDAIALHDISLETKVLTQDTVSYSVLAEQFRDVASALASRAAARDLDGVTSSYVELTKTCVACHTQINRERQFKEYPGRVSQRKPAEGAASKDATS